MISVHAGSARPFAATVASFLDSESFSHHRWATFHGRDLLVVRSPAASLALHSWRESDDAAGASCALSTPRRAVDLRIIT